MSLADSGAPAHVPVLLSESIAALQVHAQGIYVDATLGLGGHTRALLEQSAPSGRVIGFEWDAEAAARAEEKLRSYGSRFLLVQASYADILPVLTRLGIGPVDGVLADLGVSSLQLDRPERGFSFLTDNALDMRMNQQGNSATAAELLAKLSEEQLADIFYHYAEERQARRIARHVTQAREIAPIATTRQLADLVARAVPRKYHPAKVHVATKVFQGLRIAVNRELDNLRSLLDTAPCVLKPQGRLAVISFHSLEDRMVKQAFGHDLAYKIINRKAIIPELTEIKKNPRARSAKLRIAEKMVDA